MQYCRSRHELPVITVDDAGEYNVFNAKVYMGGLSLRLWVSRSGRLRRTRA
jgi:hypothetical protein